MLSDGSVVFPAWSTLVNCNLDGADLDGVTLVGAMSGTSLVGASFRGANLGGLTGSADFTNADLTNANLSGISLGGARFDGAVLDGAQLSHAKLENSHLQGTRLGLAHLAGATVGVASGTPASLPPSWILTGGVLAGPGAVLTARALDQTSFAGASLAYADLSRSVFTAARFPGVDLTGADFSYADMGRSNLTGATGYAAAHWAFARQNDMMCPDGVQWIKHNRGGCAAGVDTTPPVLKAGGADLWSTALGVTWPLTVVESGSGVSAIRYRSRSTASGRTSWTSWRTDYWSSEGFDRLWVFNGMGRRTCVQAQVIDVAGLASAWGATRCVESPYDDAQLFSARDGRWQRRVNPDYWGGEYDLTSARGASMGLGKTVTVKRVGLYATTCPTCGSVAVFVDDTKVASISLRRTTTTLRRLVFAPPLTSSVRGSIWLVVTSRSGRTVRLDGVAVSDR